MATVEELRLEFKAELKDVKSKLSMFQRELKNTSAATVSMQSALGKSQSAFAKFRDVMQGPVAGAKMLVGAIKGIASSIDGLIMKSVEAEKSQAILRSTLEATGADAWTSMGKLNEFAATMHRVTLFEDNAVNSMQAVLLGFRNIQGVNFDRASESILDMAQVMGMDLTSAAQAVGKALDNPAKGMDSLSKQGFKFSDAEKAIIQNLVETNRLAEAQDIILKELNKTFGGAAAAAAATAGGGYEQMKKAIGDMTEGYGNLLKLFANSKEGKAFIKFAYDFADASDRIGKNSAIDKIAKEMITKIPKASQVMATLTAAGVDYEYALNSIIPKVAELQDELSATTEGPAGQKRKAELEAEIASYRRLLSIIKTTTDERKAMVDAAKAEGAADTANAKYAASRAANKSRRADELYEQVYAARIAANAVADLAREQANIPPILGKITDESARMKYMNDELWEGGVDGVKKYNQELKYVSENQIALSRTIVDSFENMSSALGAAITGQEGGWKAFGKAGLDAIAAIIEAMATEAKIIAGNALLLILGGDLTKIPQLAAAAGQIALAYGAAGAVRAIPMAEGGYVPPRPGGTLALLGEAGRGEYVVPEGRGGGGNVIINVAGSVIAERQVMALGAMGARRAGRRF